MHKRYECGRKTWLIFTQSDFGTYSGQLQKRDHIATLRTMEETLDILDSYRNGRRREVWLIFVQFGSGQVTLHIYTEEGTIL